jgi:hypothetical protein
VVGDWLTGGWAGSFDLGNFCKSKGLWTEELMQQARPAAEAVRRVPELPRAEVAVTELEAAAPAAVMMAPPTPGGMCADIASVLPSFCTCDDLDLGANLMCTVNFLDLEEVSATVMIAPCATPAEVKAEIQEADMGIDYTIDYKAGDTEQIPVPGLNIGFMGYSVGVVVDLTINGNIDNLQIDIALDGCADVPIFGNECGADLAPSMLPVDLISGACGASSWLWSVWLFDTRVTL